MSLESTSLKANRDHCISWKDLETSYRYSELATGPNWMEYIDRQIAAKLGFLVEKAKSTAGWSFYTNLLEWIQKESRWEEYV